jgi:hypothetical protein
MSVLGSRALAMVRVEETPSTPPAPRACPMCGAEMRLTERGTYALLYSCRPCNVTVEVPPEPDSRLNQVTPGT